MRHEGRHILMAHQSVESYQLRNQLPTRQEALIMQVLINLLPQQLEFLLNAHQQQIVCSHLLRHSYPDTELRLRKRNRPMMLYLHQQ